MRRNSLKKKKTMKTMENNKKKLCVLFFLVNLLDLIKMCMNYG